MNILCLLVFVCFFNLGNGQDISINQWSEFNTSRNFIGKVVLVTESSHGIGRVVNALFARLGAQVVVSGKNAEEIKKTAKEMREISLFGLKVSNNYNIARCSTEVCKGGIAKYPLRKNNWKIPPNREGPSIIWCN